MHRPTPTELRWLLVPLLLFAPALLVAQPTNIRVSAVPPGDPTYQPEEVTIAINPVNPLMLVAGANVRYAYASSDGGATWTERLLPSGTWGDPCVIFDARGMAYYGHLTDYRRIGDTTARFIDRLCIHRSTDGGFSWKDSVNVGYSPPRQQDKEWLAADLTDSPWRNNLYMAWTQFDKYGSRAPSDSSRILFSRSTDGGSTWLPPLVVSDRAGDCVDSSNTVEGAVPAVGPNGEVYLAWGGPVGLMFDKSTDGGVSWGTDVLVDPLPTGWDQTISGIYRANGMPSTACDVSTSPYRGTLYVNWTDQRNGFGNTDVFVRRSTDGGKSWEAPVRVNTDNTNREQFFSWMTVDPVSGRVYVAFYDRRNTNGDATEVYVATSTDGGRSFTDARVSESAFTPAPGIFFGDYISIAARGGRVYPIWMRMDLGAGSYALSVWTAPFFDGSGGGGEPPQVFSLDQNYPNPFNSSTTIRYALTATAVTKLAVYDLLGRQVALLLDTVQGPGVYHVRFDGSGLSSGVYYYRLTAGSAAAGRAMLLVR